MGVMRDRKKGIDGKKKGGGIQLSTFDNRVHGASVVSLNCYAE